jgi:hypothetical protein
MLLGISPRFLDERKSVKGERLELSITDND